MNKTELWALMVQQGPDFHIGEAVKLCRTGDRKYGTVMIQNEQELLDRVGRAVQDKLYVGARCIKRERLRDGLVRLVWDVPSSRGGKYIVGLRYKEDSGELFGRSCMCEDALERRPGWVCKHIAATLMTRRNQMTDPIFTVTGAGFDEVASGRKSSHTFEKLDLEGHRLKETIWLVSRDKPGQFFQGNVIPGSVKWDVQPGRVYIEWK